MALGPPSQNPPGRAPHGLRSVVFALLALLAGKVEVFAEVGYAGDGVFEEKGW